MRWLEMLEKHERVSFSVLQVRFISTSSIKFIVFILKKFLHIFTVAVLNIQKKRKKKKQIEKIYTYVQMYKWIFDFIYKYSYFFSTHFFHYQLSWRDCNNRYWKSIINSTSDEEIKNKYEKQIRYFQSRSGSCV